MFSSIRQKLMVIYLGLIVIPLLIVNYVSVQNMRETILRDIEMNQLKTANILSNIARDNINDIITLKVSIKQYPMAMEARALVLDNNKTVIVDTFNFFEDRVIDNVEIRGALRREERQNYYFQEKNILQTAVPIVEARGEERIVLGVVLLSTSVDGAFEQISNFRFQLMGLSIGAGIIGCLVALFASRRIARPIEELSKAAVKIRKGTLGEEVNVRSRDEIGKLAENFNQMSKELYRIDRGRMQFIGDVSHEIKTPLASMKALIDSLLYGESDIEVYREYLRDMDNEIDRLANLVVSLLSLTKIEEVGITKEFTPIENPIKGASKVLYPLTEKSQVNIDININKEVYILCDENRITEVFINLMDNAIKYRDINKEKSNILIYDKLSKEEYVVVVEDNGVGIEEKDLKLVFEKFYRGDFSRSRDTGGAGIGLSIVSRIIAVHSWKIDIESKLGKGTKIKIRIPKNSFKVSL